MITVFVVLSIVALAKGTITSDAHGMLELSELNPTRITGRYHRIDRPTVGIQFTSTSDGLLNIADLSGTVILANQPIKDGFHLTTIWNQRYLWKKEGPVDELIKVEHSVEDVASLIHPDSLLHSSFRLEHSKQAKSSMNVLFTIEEVAFLVELCELLALNSVNGQSHPSALPLFMSTMRIFELIPHANTTLPMYRHMAPSSSLSLSSRPSPVALASPRHSRTACQEYPNRSTDCFGMCGPKCTCWRIVCGDCCWHKGCEDHDRCCRDDYWSLKCLLPVPFSCSGYNKGC